MDVAYLQLTTKCRVFNFNSTYNRPLAKAVSISNARRSFRLTSRSSFSSSDTIVTGKSSVSATKKDEEEDLMSWMNKNGLPPSKVVIKERQSYDLRHPSIHYVAASQDLQVDSFLLFQYITHFCFI